MGGDVETCSRCKRLLIEIDHFGERLIGCVRVIAGVGPGAFMELAEEDLTRFKGLGTAKAIGSHARRAGALRSTGLAKGQP